MALLPLIIDVDFTLEEDDMQELRRRINQIVAEPSAELFFVQVRIQPAPSSIGSVYGNLYRVTLCGVGGRRLSKEREFFLYRKEIAAPLLLQYIARKECPHQ